MKINRICRRLAVMLIAAVLMAGLAMSSFSEAAVSGFDSAYKKTGDYMLSKHITKDGIQVGSTAGDWTALGLARSGRLTEEQKVAYYNNVVNFVRENANEKEQLDRSKSTENARIIVALTAAGCDPRNVDGHNLLKGLSDMNFLQKQGNNGPIWALIAFDCQGYEIPAVAEGGKQVTREGLLDYILGEQLPDGGWDLNGKKADPDMTGMALQALAPYYGENEQVKAAVDKALEALSDIQLADGSYFSMGSSGSESCAQVIVALTALGIDPAEDPRFTSEYGFSVMDALLSFADSSGGFCHVTGGLVDGMATDQGYYALVAYKRFLEGQSSLYDMSDTKVSEAHSHTWGSWKTTKEATIAQTGERQRTCSECGEAQTETTAKLAPTIKLNVKSVTLEPGQSTSKVKVTYAKGDKVKSWTSGNTKIVKVSKSGKITAQKQAGTAKVTVKLASGKTASVPVKVKAVKTTAVTGLKKSVTIKKGAKYALKPVVKPANSTQKVTYATSNKKVAAVSSKGVVTGKKKGTAKITVKSGVEKAVVTVKVK